MYSLCGDGHCNVYAWNGLTLFDLGGPMKEAGNGIRADLWPLCRCIEIEIGMFVCEACEGLHLFRMHLFCEAGNEIVGNC